MPQNFPLREAPELIFAPSVGEMYPQGFATRIEVGGRAKTGNRFQAAFFSGVATVVRSFCWRRCRMWRRSARRDYQQLLVVRRLATDLGLPAEIIGAPIIREADGLAMSSRNAYLTRRAPDRPLK